MKRVWLGTLNNNCATEKWIAKYFGVENKSLRQCLKTSSLLEPLLNASLATSRTVTTLGTPSTSGTFWNLADSPCWLKAARSTLRTLDVLILNIGTIRNMKGRLSSDVVIPPKPSLVHLFLTAAPSLKSLTLFCINADLSGTPQHSHQWDGAGVFDNFKWPQLQTLRLTCCKFKASNFTNFLLYYSGSLRILELKDVELYEGFPPPLGSSLWEIAIQRLALKLALHSVVLSNVYDWGQLTIAQHHRSANRVDGMAISALNMSWWKEMELFLLKSKGEAEWARYVPLYSQPRVLIETIDEPLPKNLI